MLLSLVILTVLASSHAHYGYHYDPPPIPFTLPTKTTTPPAPHNKYLPAKKYLPPPDPCYVTVEEEWELWKKKFNKRYANEAEHDFRKKIFLTNAKYVDDHNARFAAGDVKFDLEKNKFMDIPYEELIRTRTGFIPDNSNKCVDPLPAFETEETNVTIKIVPSPSRRISELCEPKKLVDDNSIFESDWRSHGSVTDVKDQESCNSCWAFAAAGVIEAQNFKRTGKLVPFSAQNLIDCVELGYPGCNGGSMTKAFEWIKNSNGINPEDSYPYEKNQSTCRFRREAAQGKINRPVEINEGNEELLETYHNNRDVQLRYKIKPGSEQTLRENLDNVGPIAVGIYITKSASQFYKSGVFYDVGCAQKIFPNHAMLLVGYGETPKGEKFWLAKNSWGEDWGENGYIRIARDADNHCEIATYASYAL